MSTALILTSDSFESKCSYKDLVFKFPSYFYGGVQSSFPESYGALLKEKVSIDVETARKYLAGIEDGSVHPERGNFEITEDHRKLPNIVEITMAWIAYMRDRDGRHDMTTVRTPSSTSTGDRLLCLSLTRHEFLNITTNEQEYMFADPN